MSLTALGAFPAFLVWNVCCALLIRVAVCPAGRCASLQPGVLWSWGRRCLRGSARHSSLPAPASVSSACLHSACHFPTSGLLWLLGTHRYLTLSAQVTLPVLLKCELSHVPALSWGPVTCQVPLCPPEPSLCCLHVLPSFCLVGVCVCILLWTGHVGLYGAGSDLGGWKRGVERVDPQSVTQGNLDACTLECCVQDPGGFGERVQDWGLVRGTLGSSGPWAS